MNGLRLGVGALALWRSGVNERAWRLCSLRTSPWARQFYDQKRTAGKSHNAALRALGNRWLEILWHCLQHGLLYDETTHAANRNRALEPLPKAA